MCSAGVLLAISPYSPSMALQIVQCTEVNLLPMKVIAFDFYAHTGNRIIKTNNN
jgi:hypothetical protein